MFMHSEREDMGKQLAIPWQSQLAHLIMAQGALNNRVEGMQKEAASWHKEHRKWKRDIVGWQNKQRRIEALLYQLERELPDYRDVATHLSDVIEEHEHRLEEYEKLLKGFLSQEGGERNRSWKELDAEHVRQAKLHAEVQEEHDAFRTAYLSAMKKVNRLVTRLQALCN